MFMAWGVTLDTANINCRDRICGVGGCHHGDYAHVTPGTGPGRGITQGTVEM